MGGRGRNSKYTSLAPSEEYRNSLFEVGARPAPPHELLGSSSFMSLTSHWTDKLVDVMKSTWSSSADSTERDGAQHPKNAAL